MITFHSIASSSAGCAYIVRADGARPLLIECGLSIDTIRRCVDLSELAGVLVSHGHLDHCRAAGALANAGVDVWAHPSTLAGIKTKRPHLLRPICPVEKPASARARAERSPQEVDRELNGHETYIHGGWWVKSFPVDHDVDGTLAFVVYNDTDSLLYMTDAPYSRFAFKGLGIITAECNHSEELLRENVEAGVIDPARFARTSRTHMSLTRLITFLEACDLSTVRELHLLHLSDSNSNEERFKSEIQRKFSIPTIVAQRG